jgi:hypothetical protein
VTSLNVFAGIILLRFDAGCAARDAPALPGIAKAAQQLIIQTFLSIDLRPTLKDGNGKTVMESARSLWIRNLLARK